MNIQQIIDELDDTLLDLLKETYNFHLKGKPYSYIPMNGEGTSKFFTNSLNAQELVNLGLVTPINNVGVKEFTFNGPLSFSITKLGIEVIESL
ncbi:hypothetical protein [uncultured Tyzzerella sp.]|uniref:hypothetical protein n=1 Tax=uncultured Tyzzerella sp. TaxID=2321398 RepID=UPI00294298A8|nr:hypothetical protein [uncultured Tyzzerella sp.]